MASGVRLGARLCIRASTSLHCFSRARRFTTNTSTYLWRCRITSAIDTVAPKRFYANENRLSLEDPFSRRMQNEPQQTQNPADASATAQTTSSASEEGQDEEDPLLKQMMVKHERYKQWFAKVMGKDPETFGDKEVKEAVEYLMPSGLYAKDARPLFESPKQLYQQTAEVVDKKLRPLHAAFFTGQAGFHDLLFEIYEQNAKLNAVDELEVTDALEISDFDKPSEGVKSSNSELSGTSSDEGYSSDRSSDSESGSDSDSESGSGGKLDESLDSDLESGSESDLDVSSDGSDRGETESAKPTGQRKMKWIGKAELERKIGERLTDKEYDTILHRLRKLASHPNAERVTPFLLRFLRIIQIQGMRAVEKELNEEGEAFAVGHRKRAIAEVVLKKGSGSVAINNTPITKYFSRVEDRKQVMYPFLTVDAVGEYDVDCGVIGGGTTGQAGAIRLAISRALLNFKDSYVEPLQQAGLLIRDPRIKERKKPGQKRARKKFAWVRR